MATSGAETGLLKRLDRLNEFERQPVTGDKLHGGGYFAAVFSGEHIAATEFVIGALFVKFGARAFDVLVGLLLGNLLAVLSWALICAPIAVRTRLTLYWYLRKIAGPAVTAVYNVLNAVLYCMLAGAMITVSASAVRIPFGIREQTDWYPKDVAFVLLVLGVGAVVVTLAVLGFKKLAQFSSICSPWMVVMFIAGGLVALPMLGPVRSFSAFWKVAEEQIWAGAAPGQPGALGFWHVAAFAWICNLAMHVGLSDMALFRYAKHAAYGFYSAFGMYLGHYLSWICAGIMGAAAARMLSRPLADIDSGSIAYATLGAMGALTVVIAGWTTANPTLYRAGLALQVVTPGWPRWLVTLLVGAITTIIACFPFVFTRLLDFVGIYGILLMPVGAIVVMEHWVFPKIGLCQFWASRRGLVWNWPALAAWGGSLALGAYCWQAGILHLFFLAAPVWVLTAVLYALFAAVAGARESLPELPQQQAALVGGAAPGKRAEAGAQAPAAGLLLYYLSAALALAGLALIFVLSLCVFAGALNAGSFKSLLSIFTLVYFVGGIIWMQQREKQAAAKKSPAGAT